MRDDEVAGWVRSLQLRGVPLPDTLKDEVFLIIGERRLGPRHEHPLFLHFLPECPVWQSVGQYPLRADRHSYRCTEVGLHQRRHHPCLVRRYRYRSFTSDFLPYSLQPYFPYCPPAAYNGSATAATCAKIRPSPFFWTLGMSIGIICSFLAPGFTPELSSLSVRQHIDRDTLGPLFVRHIGTHRHCDFHMLPSSARFHGFRCRIRPFATPSGHHGGISDDGLHHTDYCSLPAYGGHRVGHLLLTIPQVTANIFTHSFQTHGTALHHDRLQRLSGRPLPVVPLQYTRRAPPSFSSPYSSIWCAKEFHGRLFDGEGNKIHVFQLSNCVKNALGKGFYISSPPDLSSCPSGRRVPRKRTRRAPVFTMP